MGEMDSVNSGSIQSSSTGLGDDQELESLGNESMAGFFNPASSMAATYDNSMPFQLYSFNNGSSLATPHHQTSIYHNSNSNNNNHRPTFSQYTPPGIFLINPNNDDNNNNNSNSNNNSDIKTNNDLGMVWSDKYSSIIKPSTNTMQHSSPVDDARNCTTTGPPPRPVSSDIPVPGGGGRNPKKRSRASKRTPTTVLTTDTSNFRQMVQEFTGIPDPPFSSRTRLDLFGGFGIQLPRVSSSHGGGCLLDGSSLGVQQSPKFPYPLRPFPQKISPSDHLPINSDPLSFINTTNNNHSTLDPNNATSSQMDEFALGHNATATAAAATTTVGSGNLIMATRNQERLPLERQATCSNNGSSRGNVVAPLEIHYHGSATRSEGMVDTWICSSD